MREKRNKVAVWMWLTGEIACFFKEVSLNNYFSTSCAIAVGKGQLNIMLILKISSLVHVFLSCPRLCFYTAHTGEYAHPAKSKVQAYVDVRLRWLL